MPAGSVVQSSEPRSMYPSQPRGERQWPLAEVVRQLVGGVGQGFLDDVGGIDAGSDTAVEAQRDHPSQPLPVPGQQLLACLGVSLFGAHNQILDVGVFGVHAHLRSPQEVSSRQRKRLQPQRIFRGGHALGALAVRLQGQVERVVRQVFAVGQQDQVVPPRLRELEHQVAPADLAGHQWVVLMKGFGALAFADQMTIRIIELQAQPVAAVGAGQTDVERHAQGSGETGQGDGTERANQQVLPRLAILEDLAADEERLGHRCWWADVRVSHSVD